MPSQEIYFDEDRNEIPMPLEERKKHLEEQEKQRQAQANTGKMFDAYGTELKYWDAIIALKDLPVKWWVDIKQGEKFNNITLIDDPEHISARHPKNWRMHLKTEFFKKV